MEILYSDHTSCGIQHRFDQWWTEQILCDVTLVSEDKVEIQAHFLYLAVNSVFFHQQLSSLRKNRSNLPSHFVLNIDMPSSILQILLEYLYRGELCVTENNIEEITKCALKLNLDEIVRLVKKSKFFSRMTERQDSIKCKDDVWEAPSPSYDSTDLLEFRRENDQVSHLEQHQALVSSNFEKPKRRRRLSKKEDDVSELQPVNKSTEVQNRFCRIKDNSNLEVKVRRSSRVRKSSNKITDFISLSDNDNENFDEYSGLSEHTNNELVHSLSAQSTVLKKRGKSSLNLKYVKLSRNKSELKADKYSKNYNFKRKFSDKALTKAKLRIPVKEYGRKRVSFQPMTRKLCLNYLTNKFVRAAHKASSVTHDQDYKQEPFLCCGCRRTFSGYSSWRLHYRIRHLSYLMRKISQLKLLKLCYICPKRQRRGCHGTKIEMNSGKMRRMPGPKCSQSAADMVRCEECGVMLASRSSLKKHLLAYHNMDRQQVEQHQSLLVQCEITDCAFANIDIHKVERHVRETHPEIKHPCSKCQISFVRQDLLDQHFRRIHENMTKFACCVCSQRFKKSCERKIHEQQQHGVSHNINIYSCSEEGCDYKTTAARYLIAHKRSRHLDNRIQCSYCNIKLKSKVALQMHVNALHLNKRPYLCEICGSGFCDQWTLQRHIAFRHSSDRAFSCQHCPYSCNNRIQFMNHSYQQHGQRVESDTRKEQSCPHCDYKALSTSRMNAHVRHIHADPHKYTCEICGKGFKNRHYLRDHQVTHSDSTYQCPHCDYSPLTSGKLKKHVRTQHLFKDVKPYSCPYCSFACTQSGNCRKHVVHKHPGCDVRYNTDKVMMDYMRKVEAELQAGKITSTC